MLSLRFNQISNQFFNPLYLQQQRQRKQSNTNRCQPSKRLDKTRKSFDLPKTKLKRSQQKYLNHQLHRHNQRKHQRSSQSSDQVETKTTTKFEI